MNQPVQHKRHIANMIYTPPSYSDHIAVSFFLPDEIIEDLKIEHETERETVIPASETAATHPWRHKMKSMFDFVKLASRPPLEESGTLVPIEPSNSDSKQVLPIVMAKEPMSLKEEESIAMDPKGLEDAPRKRPRLK